MLLPDVHSPCPGKGLLLTLEPTSLKDKIFSLTKSCTLDFSAKQPSRSRLATPLWNSQWEFGLNQTKGGFIGGGGIYLVVTNPL